mgnify:FL=1
MSSRRASPAISGGARLPAVLATGRPNCHRDQSDTEDNPSVQVRVPEGVDAERGALRRAVEDVFGALADYIWHTPTYDSQRAFEHLEETLARTRSSLESDRGNSSGSGGGIGTRPPPAPDPASVSKI